MSADLSIKSCNVESKCIDCSELRSIEFFASEAKDSRT